MENKAKEIALDRALSFVATKHNQIYHHLQAHSETSNSNMTLTIEEVIEAAKKIEEYLTKD